MEPLYPFPPKSLDYLYLDTTFANPRYTFPSQPAAIAAAVALSRPYEGDRGTLLLFGMYTIGKERLFLAVARALKERVYVTPAQFKVLSLLNLPPADAALLTQDPKFSRIHVVTMKSLTLGNLEKRWRSMGGGAAL